MSIFQTSFVLEKMNIPSLNPTAKIFQRKTRLFLFKSYADTRFYWEFMAKKFPGWITSSSSRGAYDLFWPPTPVPPLSVQPFRSPRSVQSRAMGGRGLVGEGVNHDHTARAVSIIGPQLKETEHSR